MELRPVEQFSEDQRDLFFDDSGPVVLDGHLEPVLGNLFDVDPDFRKDAGLFTCIE